MKLAWHTPRIVVEETVGPFGCCKIYTLYTGRRIVVPGPPPIVTNELDIPRLITVIADLIAPLSSHDFTQDELCGYAEETGGWLQDVLQGKSSAQVGKLLRRIAGRTVDGARIIRHKRRWEVEYVR